MSSEAIKSLEEPSVLPFVLLKRKIMSSLGKAFVTKVEGNNLKMD